MLFEAVVDYFEVYKIQFEEMKQKERSTTDVLIYNKKRFYEWPLQLMYNKEYHECHLLAVNCDAGVQLACKTKW